MQTPSSQLELKWDLRQRLKLLEATLLLAGWVRTQALVDAFGISRVQASKDFSVYQRLRPKNLVYDKSAKHYGLGDDFAPLLLSGKSSELLEVLFAIPHGDGPVLALARQAPAVDLLQPIEREIDLQAFRVVSAAASNGGKFRAWYQSMSRSEPVWLTLSPHTLVYSGFRWHVRAFSDSHDEFRDFVLTRMEAVETQKDAALKSKADDTEWETQQSIQIVPHPDLNSTQRQIIIRDYGMTMDGVREITMRRALIPYFLRLMQIEPGRLHEIPQIQQIVLLSPVEKLPLWS